MTYDIRKGASLSRLTYPLSPGESHKPFSRASMATVSTRGSADLRDRREQPGSAPAAIWACQLVRSERTGFVGKTFGTNWSRNIGYTYTGTSLLEARSIATTALRRPRMDNYGLCS